MKGLFLYDESLYKILPDELIKDIGIYAGFQHVREIRLRTGRLPAAICDNGEHRGAVPVDEHMITRILSIATNYSSYAYESCMANGFLTIKGGHRIGLGGQVIVVSSVAPNEDDATEVLNVNADSAADRKSTRLNSSHTDISRMPSSA